MTKRLILILTLICLGLLMGCQTERTEINNSPTGLIVSDYFPTVGLNRTYIQYGTNGENLIAYDTVKVEVDSSGEESVYIHETGGLAIESLKEYKINEHTVRVIQVTNPILNKEVDEVELTNKKSWNVGDSDNALRTLTSENLEISVPAGTFEDCIEVTQVIKTEENTYTSIYYYAPTIGLIKTVWELDDEKFTAIELQSYSNEIKQVIDDGQSQVEEPKEESSEELPSPQFQSGKLPIDKKITSTLNINEYSNRVNQNTFEQLEYYVLHRPAYEETNNETVFQFIEGITIRCDKNGNIKEVIMDEENKLTEEKLLVIQALLLGLDSELTIEEANKIIFPDEANQIFKVGEFNVGLHTDSNGFTFKAIPY